MSGFPNSGGVSSSAANTFTNSPQTISIPGVGNIGLIVKAFAGQTANLQEWQNSAGTILNRVSASGSFLSSGRISAGSNSSAVANLNSYITDPTLIGLFVRGASSQTGDLAQFQNSAGAVLLAVGANGTIATGTTAGAPTIASAATIAPVTPIAFVSGVITINTITPPAPISNYGGQITLIPTGIFTTGVSGNIAIGSTAVVSKALILTYDPITTKWYPSY